MKKILGIILTSMMFLTACNSTDEAQGYGTHIFGQPAEMLAGDGNPQDFGIPEGYVPLDRICPSGYIRVSNFILK